MAPRWTARLTGRAVLLAAVIVLLIVSLAYPLQRYLAQQAAIDRLQADNAAAQQRVEDLRTDLDRLDDPAYIETQARARLQYVMPGDLLYVIDDNGAPQAVAGQSDPVSADGGEQADTPAGAQRPADLQTPWFQRVLDSIAAADGGG